MNTRESSATPLHYAWIIAFTGVWVIFSCLGLGRFSLGMLLPSMGASLGLTYGQMGLIGTGNFCGYMLSILFAAMLAKAMGPRRTVVLGLILVGGSMILISRARGFGDIMALYLATGVGSGLANIPMMGLVSQWFLSTTRGRAAGIMLSGNGIAIVLTGLFVPWINTVLGSQGWRTGWLTLGAVSLGVAVVAGTLLRNHPKEKGLSPLGTLGAAPAKAKHKPAPARTMVHLGLVYALFGATYAVYVTFIVTAMVNERGFGESTAGKFWAVVGALSVFSGPLFGWISDRLGRKAGMVIVYSLFTLAYGLAGAAHLPVSFLYASIGLFGIAVWSIPTIMSAAAGDYAGPDRAVKALGFITLFFGAGQVIGPAVAGFLADALGSFSMGFWLCTGLTTLAVAGAALLKPPG